MIKTTFKARMLIILSLLVVAGAVAFAGNLAAQDAAKAKTEAAKTEAAKKEDAPKADAKKSDAAPAADKSAWIVRCDDIKDKDSEKVTGQYCEMVQSISVAKKDADPSTAQRIFEIALGYPPVDKQRTAASVVIMPLGVLVTQDVVLEIDGDKFVDFKIQYCDAGGCIGTFQLKDKQIEKLLKGKALTVKAVAATGQPVVIELSLNGFAGAYDKIKPKKG